MKLILNILKKVINFSIVEPNSNYPRGDRLQNTKYYLSYASHDSRERRLKEQITIINTNRKLKQETIANNNYLHFFYCVVTFTNASVAQW